MRYAGVGLHDLDRIHGVFGRTLLSISDHVGNIGVSVCVVRVSFRRAD